MPKSLQDVASATPGFANNLDSSSLVSERLSPTLSLAFTASNSRYEGFGDGLISGLRRGAGRYGFAVNVARLWRGHFCSQFGLFEPVLVTA